MRRTITRRRALLTGAVVGTGALGSIALGSGTAAATVSGDFQIPNGKTVLADSELQDVRLAASVDWGFSANAPMHKVELELHVGQTVETADLIARHTQDDLSKSSLTGSTNLNGSLMSASDFSIDDFRPSSGELRRTVVADLRLYVLRHGEVATEARQTTAFDVIVSKEELKVDTTLDATGEVTFTTESG